MDDGPAGNAQNACTMKNFHTPRASSTLLILSVAASLVLSGCSLHPYVRTSELETSLPKPVAAANPEYAGELEQAIADVDKQRSEYLNKLVKRTEQRNSLSGALITLSAGALYSGLTIDASSSTRAVANLGTLAGGAYALGNYSNSPGTELAYIRAANDLTCLVMRTRPWLMKTGDYDAFKKSADRLESSINVLDALYQRQVAQSTNESAFLKQTAFQRGRLHDARLTLRKAHSLKGFVETAGFHLRQDAMLVSNTTNLEIHRLQPALADPTSFATSLRSTAQAFRDIKPLDVGAPDKQEDDADKADKSDKNGTASAPANPASAAVGSTTTTTSDLGKEADKLSAQIDVLTQSLAKEKAANKDATSKTNALVAKHVKELAALTERLQAVEKAITTAGAEASVVIAPDKKAAEKVAAEMLAAALADVFQAVRPVNSGLTRAYSLKPFVKDIPECRQQDGQVLAFTLDKDEIPMMPGQTLDVAVTGGLGIPKIWMSGAAGSTDEKAAATTLTTSIDGGLARAKLVIGSKVPDHDIYIMAVDGSGKQKDQIKVIVKAQASKSK